MGCRISLVSKLRRYWRPVGSAVSYQLSWSKRGSRARARLSRNHSPCRSLRRMYCLGLDPEEYLHKHLWLDMAVMPMADTLVPHWEGGEQATDWWLSLCPSAPRVQALTTVPGSGDGGDFGYCCLLKKSNADLRSLARSAFCGGISQACRRSSGSFIITPVSFRRR